MNTLIGVGITEIVLLFAVVLFVLLTVLEIYFVSKVDGVDSYNYIFPFSLGVRSCVLVEVAEGGGVVIGRGASSKSKDISSLNLWFCYLLPQWVFPRFFTAHGALTFCVLATVVVMHVTGSWYGNLSPT